MCVGRVSENRRQGMIPPVPAVKRLVLRQYNPLDIFLQFFHKSFIYLRLQKQWRDFFILGGVYDEMA